jgi:outer membrane receptor protein involved in Fe transport
VAAVLQHACTGRRREGAVRTRRIFNSCWRRKIVSLSAVTVCALSMVGGGATAQEEAPKRAARLETVVVTATRTGLAPDQPSASVTVLDRQDITDSADIAVDDILRAIPGFSLYRRSSSMVTSPDLDPEAQGVTLRNIGPSGTSRALVLVDGVPLIDPYDGQVFWGKIPKENIERIEVVRGAGASLWGNYAMAGVINIITRKPTDTGAAVEASYGTDNLTDDDLYVSGRSGKFLVGLEGNFFNTDGFPIVASDQRGPIDGNASSRHEIFNGRVGYQLNDTDTVFLHGQYFDENYNSGTPLRTSGTSAGLIDLSTLIHTDDGSEWQAQVFSNMQSFHIQFTETSTACSACHSSLSQPARRNLKPLVVRHAAETDPHEGIVDDRTAEHRTLYQTVPFTDVGGSLVWSRRVLERLVTTAGADLHWIDGQSRDQFYDEEGADVELRRRSDGKQFFGGVFLQGIYTPEERWEIALGGRIQVWDNYDGTVTDTPDVGVASTTAFSSQTHVDFDPKLSASYRATDWLTVRGAVYRAFRAPTLAELYRRSAVEGLQMLPNPDLTAEHLTGAELGVDLPLLDNFDLRTTGFWDEIKDPVTNIDVDPDLCQTPTGEATGRAGQDEEGGATCRMRANLGLARTVGAEVEALYEIFPPVTLYGSYLFADGTMVSAPGHPDIQGKALQQVPPHTFTLGVRYTNPALFTFQLEGRFVDDQFEDAENDEPMSSYFILNGSLSRRLPFWNGQVFIAAQNLFDREYIVDRGGGIFKTGTPLLGYGGVRFKL